MASSPDALSVTVQAIVERIQIEAHKNIRHSKRVILANLLKALAELVQEESICKPFASVIDCQLAPLYQLVEARIIPEYDQDILSLMKSFVFCSEQTGMNLYQAVIYLSEVIGDMPTCTTLISELVNVMLKHGDRLFVEHHMQVTPEDSTEVLTIKDDHNPNSFTKELSTLGYAMANAAYRWQSDTKSSFGHDGVVAASNVCQLVIHVVIVSPSTCIKDSKITQ